MSHLSQASDLDISRIEAVVFDLGGVILEGPIEAVAGFGRRIGMEDAAWKKLLMDIFVGGDSWPALERGEITLEAFLTGLQADLAAHGVELPLADVAGFMGGAEGPVHLHLRPEVVEMCQALYQRLPTALLTNNVTEWRPGWTQRLDLEALFDQVVDSSLVGCRKPEPAIYHKTEQALGLPGSALVLVDDLGQNLKAATQRGWQALRYHRHANATAEVLEALSPLLQRPSRSVPANPMSQRWVQP